MCKLHHFKPMSLEGNCHLETIGNMLLSLHSQCIPVYNADYSVWHPHKEQLTSLFLPSLGQWCLRIYWGQWGLIILLLYQHSVEQQIEVLSICLGEELHRVSTWAPNFTSHLLPFHHLRHPPCLLLTPAGPYPLFQCSRPMTSASIPL